MPVAGDEHHIRPIVRLHGDTSRVSTGDVEGGGAAAARTLDARAGQLLHTVATIYTLLQRARERLLVYKRLYISNIKTTHPFRHLTSSSFIP